jgi:hypothetical protein
MKIKLDFHDNHYIIIDVFEENSQWFNFFEERKKLNEYNPSLELERLCCYSDNYDAREWDKIVENTEYLKSQNFKLPYELPEKFDHNQELLNVIHRFFTYNSLWALQYCNHDMTGITPLVNMEPNPFDNSFIPNDLEKFLTTISNLNLAVHKLELSCMTLQKNRVLAIIKNNSMRRITINHYEFTSNGWLVVGSNFDELQKSYTNNYPNVIMSEEIQGKSYLRAFIDNDDPTKLDVTGRYGSYGGFIIDTNTDRRSVYESPEFNDWLGKYGLDKKELLLEWPLGQVIESTLDLNQFYPHQFIDMQFIND